MTVGVFNSGCKFLNVIFGTRIQYTAKTNTICKFFNNIPLLLIIYCYVIALALRYITHFTLKFITSLWAKLIFMLIHAFVRF